MQIGWPHCPAWIHDDLQFKNVLEGDDGALVVMDLTDGSWAPRVFDLAYVLTVGGDDECVPDTGVPTLEHEFAARLRTYHEAGGKAFTQEEIFLLPNALQIKLTAAAHYWWRYQPRSQQFCKLAVWAEMVVDVREVLRAAATASNSS